MLSGGLRVWLLVFFLQTCGAHSRKLFYHVPWFKMARPCAGETYGAPEMSTTLQHRRRFTTALSQDSKFLAPLQLQLLAKRLRVILLSVLNENNLQSIGPRPFLGPRYLVCTCLSFPNPLRLARPLAADESLKTTRS